MAEESSGGGGRRRHSSMPIDGAAAAIAANNRKTATLRRKLSVRSLRVRSVFKIPETTAISKQTGGRTSSRALDSGDGGGDGGGSGGGGGGGYVGGGSYASPGSRRSREGPDVDDETGPSADYELPFPGFVPKALHFFKQTTRPRSWCLACITWPYPFRSAKQFKQRYTDGRSRISIIRIRL